MRSDYTSLYDASGAEVYKRVALLLRHPYDCFTSHYLGRAGVNFAKGLEQFEAYAINITRFDALKERKKGVFFFEDFINNEEGTLAFLRFFDIDPGARPYNFPEMIEASRAWYHGHHGLFVERERPQLKSKERAAILRMLKRQLGQKFERHLGRYSFSSTETIQNPRLQNEEITKTPLLCMCYCLVRANAWACRRHKTKHCLHRCR